MKRKIYFSLLIGAVAAMVVFGAGVPNGQVDGSGDEEFLSDRMKDMGRGPPRGDDYVFDPARPESPET